MRDFLRTGKRRGYYLHVDDFFTFTKSIQALQSIYNAENRKIHWLLHKIIKRSDMKIRKTTLEELDILLNLYNHARMFMAAHNNPTQWGTGYPPRELLESDILEGCSYVCEEHHKVIATFYYRFGEDDTYRKIYNGQWLDEEPYGVVHRITSDGTIKGTASFCFDWALAQCGSLKIDTHRDNLIMQHLLQKNGFTRCGMIYLEDGSERIAYQKKAF